MESNVVKIYGKKQLDIREDNKSAVINVLLQQESTLPQIAEKLGLSLTALAKVMKELQQKEVVRIVKEETVAYGRPAARLRYQRGLRHRLRGRDHRTDCGRLLCRHARLSD